MNRDKSALGMAPGIGEPAVDRERVRRDRLANVQREMAAREYGALLLTNPVHIRYATGLSVMPIWTALNLARYALIPVEGEPRVFEYGKALFRSEALWKHSKPAKTWQHRFGQHESAERARDWATEIRALLREAGTADARLGVDNLDFYGFEALAATGLRLADADEPMQAARLVKTADEIELVKQSVVVAETAMYELEQAIRPGVSEHELLGVFWHRMLALGGEHCSTRLIVSGHKTNPWFHEAGSKLVRPGDLVGIDTDMIGPDGYLCDISRTFLCGERATPEQKECYRVAYDVVHELVDLCRPGVSFRELYEKTPRFPEIYQAQAYPCMLHGAGCDDEPPFIPFRHDPGVIPEGCLRENMVLCVEFYAGKPGQQDGVKLEEQLVVTKGGPVVLSAYPFDGKLL